MKFKYRPNEKLCIDGVAVQFNADGEYYTEDELVIKVLSNNPDVKGKAKPKEEAPKKETKKK